MMALRSSHSKNRIQIKTKTNTVLAWQTHNCEPQFPGRQGQDITPKKGDAATSYLTGEGKEPFEPITPNGMVTYPVVVD